ncbi:MAG: hypothetical protein ACK4UN_10340 [Limisphaerales bacterium]
MGFLASIIGRVSLDASGYERGTRQVERATNRMASNVANRVKSMIGVAALTVAAQRTVAYASKIKSLAEQAGEGTEALQELGFAAMQNSSSMEAMAKFLEELNISRARALGGNASDLKAFAQLGVTQADLMEKRASDIAKIIGKTVQAGDVQKLIAPLREVGGKGSRELIGAFKAGLEEGGQQAREIGAIIADDTVQQLERVGSAFDALKVVMISHFAPAVIKTAELLLTAVYVNKRERARFGAAMNKESAQKSLSMLVPSLAYANIARGMAEKIKTGEKIGLKELIEVLAAGTSTPVNAASIIYGSRAGQKAADEVDEEFARVLASFMASVNSPTKGKFGDDQDADGAIQHQDTFKSSFHQINTDYLNRMGGFVGGAEMAMVSVQKEIARNTKIAAESGKKSAEILGRLSDSGGLIN